MYEAYDYLSPGLVQLDIGEQSLVVLKLDRLILYIESCTVNVLNTLSLHNKGTCNL